MHDFPYPNLHKIPLQEKSERCKLQIHPTLSYSMLEIRYFDPGKPYYRKLCFNLMPNSYNINCSAKNSRGKKSQYCPRNSMLGLSFIN